MNANSKTSRQLYFLDRINDLVPVNSSLVHELSDILGISTDSAYRRMRGETSLSLDEAVEICAHFKIPLESFIETKGGSVTFRYDRIKNTVSGFEKYLSNQLNYMNMVTGARDQKITYACRDIPIFHHYRYPVFSSFKMFYWMKSVMNVEEFKNAKFDMSLIPDNFHEIGMKSYKAYLKIPSIEIWTETTVNSALKQVEFYWDSGLFKSVEDAIEICDSIRLLLTDIRDQAEHGAKFITAVDMEANKDNFRFYSSDIEVGNNQILVQLGDVSIIFHNHSTFFVMSSSNKKYVEETSGWLDGLIKKSTLLTGVSQKHRYQYFKKVLDKLDRLIAKIEE